MSGTAMVWAASLKGIRLSAKMVLIQLAERHNKDTGRCDPSIKKLAEDCEMHRATVLRNLSYLEEMGLLTRVSRGSENGGRASSQYELHMGVKSQNATGEKSHQSDGGKVASDIGKSRTTVTEKSHQRDPLYIDKPKKNPKEPIGDRFEEFWKLVPKKSGKDDALKAFKAALKRASFDEILDGARRYAEVRRGQDPQFHKGPAAWLRAGMWKDEYPSQQSPDGQDPERAKKVARWNRIAAE